MKYQVTGIFDAPYGCEEQPEVLAELELNGADGSFRKLTVPDRVLTEQNIREGDWVQVSEEGAVRRTSGAPKGGADGSAAKAGAPKKPEDHDFTPYFGKMMDGVKAYVRSEHFPETYEDSKERIESYIFTMTEYLSWVVFTYKMAGMQWYARYLYGVKGRKEAENVLERYADLQQEYTALMQQLYQDSRFEEMLKEDQMAVICLVLSVRTAEKLWQQGLTRKERQAYDAFSTLDHALAAAGENFRSTDEAYHFDFTGDKVMDTAMSLCYFMIGEFNHEYIQAEYAKIHGIA